MGVTSQLDYSTDGDKIILKSPKGSLVLTRNKDGSINSPWGTLKKQDQHPGKEVTRGVQGPARPFPFTA